MHANALMLPHDTSEADRRSAHAGTQVETLMRRAGTAIADIVSRQLSVGSRVVIACGPGANGGDGFVAAAILKRRGYRVELGCIGPREALSGLQARVAAEWPDPVQTIEDLKPDGAERVIDALFGAGLSRAIEGPAAAAIERINMSGASVLAVDLPSGLDGATGRALGPVVRASETICFERRRPAHLLLPGRLLCGIVHVVPIGVPQTVLDALHIETFANGPALWRDLLPKAQPDGHKYDRGCVLVLSGGIEGAGAARLSARAALRAGAGLVVLAVPEEALGVQAATNTAVMVRRADGLDGWRTQLADPRRNAVVIGPAAGVGEETRECVLAALHAGRAAAFDADALTSFADDPQPLFEAIGRNPAGVVLTPHAGEFAKLFPADAATGEAKGRLAAARAAAARSGATLVLKGFDTIIAAPDGRAAINENATPELGTAGSGDVLAGIIGGLLAQHMPAFEAASAGVWLHAEAGAGFGPGLISEDLPDRIPAALRAVGAKDEAH